MDRREKLLQKMRNSPAGIRFGEVETLLRCEGFVLFNRRARRGGRRAIVAAVRELLASR
jgi:hypothetical protein